MWFLMLVIRLYFRSAKKLIETPPEKISQNTMNFYLNVLFFTILFTPCFILIFDQVLFLVQNRYIKLYLPLKIKPTVHYNLIIKTILK